MANLERLERRLSEAIDRGEITEQEARRIYKEEKRKAEQETGD